MGQCCLVLQLRDCSPLEFMSWRKPSFGRISAPALHPSGRKSEVATADDARSVAVLSPRLHMTQQTSLALQKTLEAP